MAFFTEQMEMLTNELLTSRQERAAFVVDVQQKSHKVLAEAQTFMHVLSGEHVAMAERLRTDLAANGQERLRVVKAQRQQNREQLQIMRKGLQETLARTRSERQKHVAALRTDCRAAQKDLASDLRQAAQAWQRMLQTCATTNGGPKGKVKVTAGATTTQAGPKVNVEETGKAHDHGHGHAAESKKPTHAESKTATHDATLGGHDGKAHDHGHGHAAESKKPTHAAAHGHGHAAESKEPAHSTSHGGHHGKAKEPRHSH